MIKWVTLFRKHYTRLGWLFITITVNNKYKYVSLSTYKKDERPIKSSRLTFHPRPSPSPLTWDLGMRLAKVAAGRGREVQRRQRHLPMDSTLLQVSFLHHPMPASPLSHFYRVWQRGLEADGGPVVPLLLRTPSNLFLYLIRVIYLYSCFEEMVSLVSAEFCWFAFADSRKKQKMNRDE